MSAPTPEPKSTEPNSTEPNSSKPSQTEPGSTETGPTETGPTEPGSTETSPTEPAEAPGSASGEAASAEGPPSGAGGLDGTPRGERSGAKGSAEPRLSDRTRSAADTAGPLAPKACRVGVLGLVGAGVLTSLWGIWASITPDPPTWIVFALCVASLTGVGFAVPAGLGRDRDGFGLVTLNTAGVLVASALFGWLDARQNFASPSNAGRWALAHAGAGAGFAVVSAIAVLARRRGAWPRVIAGGGLLGVLGVAAVVGLRTGLFGLGSPAEGSAEAFRMVAILAIGVVAIVIASAGGHLLIRGFEHGHIDRAGGRDAGARAGKPD